jgi:predicted DCC family thiol-disulfide oxidoreductase YuxK
MSQQDTIRPVLFFDGECNLCNSGVQFLIKRDKQQKFLFASLQSPAGQRALENIPGHPDSFIVYDNGRYYIKSDAGLRVFKLLGGTWSLLYSLMIFPRFVRDWVYNIIARNRYKWFGKRNECMIPTPELRARFIDT